MIETLIKLLNFFPSILNQTTGTQDVQRATESDGGSSVGVRFFEKLFEVWNFRLFKAGDDFITVSQLTLTLFFLVLAMIALKKLRTFLRSKLLVRFGVHKGAAAALSKLIYYVCLVITLIFAMQLVGIPMTVFTIFGGAAAIGVGFGAQNIINNFISGVILLIERPVRVGDFIEVDDQSGVVDSIGARCSRIRTPDNVHILVPNSRLLDNMVINWTLSDEKVRALVSVGVAYGSDVEKVFKILGEIMREKDRILKNPEPMVIFKEFGADSLNFECFFWMIMKTVGERIRLESDVRREINRRFEEAGIVIAFPQRDVHLDAEKPLDVRLIKRPENKE